MQSAFSFKIHAKLSTFTPWLVTTERMFAYLFMLFLALVLADI